MFVANITPIVAACVVCAIGMSLFSVGTNSFGGGNVSMPDFGSMKYLFIGAVTLVTCLVWQFCVKGVLGTYSIIKR